jgi:hypothetical protein
MWNSNNVSRPVIVLVPVVLVVDRLYFLVSLQDDEFVVVVMVVEGKSKQILPNHLVLDNRDEVYGL